jgi:ankyrin repeat protein
VVLKEGISSAFHGKFYNIGKFLLEKYLMLVKEPSKSLISNAIQGENLGALKLLQKHIEMDTDIFREALYKGNLEIIKYLYDLGLRDEDPFMNAVGSNNIKVIEYLLEKGYKVNGSNIVDAISVHKIDIAILRLLFKNLKKPINKTYNNAILDEALRRSDETLYIIKYLIEEENLVLDNQLMHLAIMSGKLEVVKYFVSKGAEINSGYVLYPYPNLSSKVRNYLVSVLRDRGEDVI